MSVILTVHFGVYLFMSVLDRLLTVSFICMAIVSKSKNIVCHIVALLKIVERLGRLADFHLNSLTLWKVHVFTSWWRNREEN